ncbi:GIY-YIG nuclease family protein [Maribellus luteus]|uniref:GIY-YIG nuclease family protein n=1 Tax=Maribellus luteus TaxID=2305463 RepID=A0A399SXJ2_9BACT|nr:GIY-YIG nuclease family protein [Maribellus luteus]
MPYFAYVLYSQKYNRLYKGHCQDIQIRVNQHNTGQTQSTKPFIPWSLVYFEKFDTREEAIKREKYFKTASGRRFLKHKLRLP